jgi:hypothetical protein
MWYHLLDQSGLHWIINPAQFFYFMSKATDGSQPIIMTFPLFNLQFVVTAAQFTAIVGTLPAVNDVQTYSPS